MTSPECGRPLPGTSLAKGLKGVQQESIPTIGLWTPRSSAAPTQRALILSLSKDDVAPPLRHAALIVRGRAVDRGRVAA